ncbi:MAG: alanine dehydrogenase, partial [Acidobacteria bacterium]|nr:alanine dehydrogenase [Acidobacteriota bacterium]
MIVGIPREKHRLEHRVGLTPAAVRQLVHRGHSVVVEHDAGTAAHFADHDYEQAGATIVYTAEEAYRRADLVCRVGPVVDSDLPLLNPGSTLCSFHHLAVSSTSVVERLLGLGVTLIGYEVIRDDDGALPVLRPLSEIAGQLAVHIAAQYLQREHGGRGILLGAVPGVPPPTVLVLGAGTAGEAATRQALAAGAHVIAVDLDLERLQHLHRTFDGRVVTSLAGLGRVQRYTAFADVVVGAVLIPGGRTEPLISEQMVRTMKAGSVIVDLSIDQGGCVETSRPTTLADPVYEVHEVIHYCVPNMTSTVARTASRALGNACLPYVA